MITKYGDEVPALDKAIEECAEVLQILMKIKRFGLYDTHPTLNISNYDMMMSEMNDLDNAIIKLIKENK
jgi:hypothetical protein